MNKAGRAKFQEKKPSVWLNGKRVKVVPECAGCGLIPEGDIPPQDWEYVELDPFGGWGWLCPKCMMQNN